MIKYTPSSERSLALFRTPFEQKLSPENRWVKMAELVPWDEMAQVFFSCLSANQGRPTVDLRIILGALLVKHIEGLSDEDTIQYIQENIYAQYFVGLSSFQVEPVFVPSLFVEIRKRLGRKGSAKLNDLLIGQASRLKVIKHRDKGKEKTPPPSPPDGSELAAKDAAEREANKDTSPGNQGTLLLDATVGPLHIAFPTDTRLLSEARRHSERLINRLYASGQDLWPVKPRTYRRVAKKAFVHFSKKKRKDKKRIRKATGQQLRYLRRNLKTLNKMLDLLESQGVGVCWTKQEWRMLWIIQELYRQQAVLFADRRRRIDDRIISLQQPHARPIKRGKAGGKDTEFGPKLNLSMTEGISRVDQIDFNAFNEAAYLKDQIEGYKELYGYYPNLVLADRIYWTRANRKYLKNRGIELSGVPLGPAKDLSRHEQSKARKRNNKRSEIEGKFGQAKSKYGLDDLQTRLPQTIMAQINLIFLAMNLLRMKKSIFRPVFIYFLPMLQARLDLHKPKYKKRRSMRNSTSPVWTSNLEMIWI